MRYIIVLCCVLLVGCQSSQLTWSQAMTEKLNDYDAYSRHALTPYFKKADLPYAPKELAFIVLKKSKRFEIYARNRHQHWRYIKTFPIYAASGGPGPKLHVNDDQVPEGIYHIIGLNPQSRFDLSMHLNYPNAFDLAQAAKTHRHNLGGNIFIHGSDRSIGCIALGDAAIQQIFPLVYTVGEHHVVVIIAPHDLRKNPLVVNREHVSFASSLYARLRRELRRFPLV